MATLSKKTLGIAIRCIGTLNRRDIDLFLYENEIPESFMEGDSRTRLLLNVFQRLERNGNEDILRELIFQAIHLLSGSCKEHLKDALLKDGFVVDGETIAEDVPVAESNRLSLEMLIDRNSTYLDMTTLRHHLTGNIELFRQERWDSAIGQARNFVERLLGDIAIAIGHSRNENPDLTRPVRVREYLQRCGFFDEGEKQKLVDGVYGYFSEEGSHPGISEQSIARVCMHILWAFAYYVLEKFEDWKQQNGLR